LKMRTYAVTLVEVIIAAAISILIIMFTISGAVAISKFTQQALHNRIIDSQTSQGTDAIAKELRDGIAVLSSATIVGKTYTTSSSCVVFSAVAYDFSKSNPLLESSDTVVYSYSSANSRVTRSCGTGAGSKRPATNDSHVVTGTDCKFTFRVAEAIEWINTSTSTASETLRLATIPLQQPSCTRNGISIPCAWQTGSQNLTVQTPAGASSIGIQYPVSPSPSSCPHITSVEIQVKRTTASPGGLVTTVPHITEARLRNKR
jgi:hypothetical protein